MTTQFDIALQNLMEAFLAATTLPETQRYKVGLYAEELFAKYAQKAGYKVIAATPAQDKDERWDFNIEKPNGKYNGKIDVKASKGTFDERYMYVTLINGSGYGEPFFRSAKYIAIKEANSGSDFFRMFKRMVWALRIQQMGNFTIENPHHRDCRIVDNDSKYSISAHTDISRYPELFTDNLNKSRLSPIPKFYKSPQNTIGLLVPMNLANFEIFE